MVRLITPILRQLNINGHQFWDVGRATAETLLDEAISEVNANSMAKVFAAQNCLASRLFELDVAQRELVMSGLRGRFVGSIDHAEQAQCPACAEGTILYQVEDTGEPQAEYEQVDGEEFVVHAAWIGRIAYPVLFSCPVCELQLADRELTSSTWATASTLSLATPRQPKSSTGPGQTTTSFDAAAA